jgi:hypothetical protein
MIHFQEKGYQENQLLQLCLKRVEQHPHRHSAVQKVMKQTRKDKTLILWRRVVNFFHPQTHQARLVMYDRGAYKQAVALLA